MGCIIVDPNNKRIWPYQKAIEKELGITKEIGTWINENKHLHMVRKFLKLFVWQIRRYDKKTMYKLKIRFKNVVCLYYGVTALQAGCTCDKR